VPLPTPIDVVLAVVAVLERLGVRYAVGGSFASSLHGVFRASVDVDIVAELADQHVSPIVRELSETFYLDETAIRRAVDSRRSFNLIHLATMFKVDVFLPTGRAFDDQALLAPCGRRGVRAAVERCSRGPAGAGGTSRYGIYGAHGGVTRG